MALAQQLHSTLANAASIFTALVALYTLVLILQKREIGGDYWGAIVIGEVLLVAHALAGLVLIFGGAAPARVVHFLYGTTALITWPAIFAFTKGATGRREMWFWLLGSAFLFGVTLRASQTGRVPLLWLLF